MADKLKCLKFIKKQTLFKIDLSKSDIDGDSNSYQNHGIWISNTKDCAYFQVKQNKPTALNLDCKNPFHTVVWKTQRKLGY